MVRTQIQLTDEQARKLRELAHQRKISMAEATREAIDQWLQAAGHTTEEERRRRASEAVGRFRSGKGDVSERHDDYLAEAFSQ